MMDTRISASVFDPPAELAVFSAGRRDMGALVSFVGLCRDHHDGEPVSELFLDHYPGFTERVIAGIARDIAARCHCPDLLVIHRVGTVLPGEAIVLVAALCEHRANAFDAVRLLMDYLKTDAPLWKRQTGPGGVHWIEPRPEDLARRAQAEGMSV